MAEASREVVRPSVQVLPLTTEKTAAVLASLKRGGYRTPGNYLSRAKDERVRHKYPWSDDLGAEGRSGCRSVMRGQAPFEAVSTFPH